MTELDWTAVGRAARSRRAALRRTQKRVAADAGLDVSTVRNVETSARSSFDEATLGRLSGALDLGVGTLWKVANRVRLDEYFDYDEQGQLISAKPVEDAEDTPPAPLSVEFASGTTLDQLPDEVRKTVEWHLEQARKLIDGER